MRRTGSGMGFNLRTILLEPDHIPSIFMQPT